MMQSQIILPSAPLRPFVHHYWTMQADGNAMELNIMPVGCMKWMFHRGRPFTVNGIFDAGNYASVCGQYDMAAHVGMQGHTDLIFVFFRPYAMKMVTGIPCDKLNNANIDMDDLELPEFHRLKQMVADTTDNASAIRIIEDFIAGRLARQDDSGYLKQFEAIYHAMELRPDLSLASMAETACMSERQLRRVFMEHIGLAPKHMMRIYRCLAASRAIQQMDSRDFTDIVYRLGFTDHSHLYKEFKMVAGMSPTDYLGHVESLKSHNLIRGYRTYHK